MSIKFGVCADLHVDMMHDCEERLDVFLNACRRENVDFVIPFFVFFLGNIYNIK